MDINNPLNSEHLSGFIVIAGPPNVGKSTLLNRLLKTRVSIVTAKPQTTRNRIMGILNGPGYQMVFMDTPGIHSTRTPLHKSMVASAQSAFHEVDIILVMIDMTCPRDSDFSLISKEIKKAKKPVILVINKIDKVLKEEILPIIDSYSKLYSFDAVIPLSALKGDGIDKLLEELKSRLIPGPAFFPEDMNSDQSESFFVSEIIREQIYKHTKQELPYSAAVTVNAIKDHPEKPLISISAHIHVESESQKAIFIGRHGKMIKKIGKSSRQEIEKAFGAQVFLDLMVRVQKNWTKDPKALRKLGY